MNRTIEEVKRTDEALRICKEEPEAENAPEMAAHLRVEAERTLAWMYEREDYIREELTDPIVAAEEYLEAAQRVDDGDGPDAVLGGVAQIVLGLFDRPLPGFGDCQMERGALDLLGAALRERIFERALAVVEADDAAEAEREAAAAP